MRFLLAVFFALAATAQQYPFLPVAGSPQSVRILFQDSTGRLWTGGEDLACFDGSRFFYLRDYGLPPGDTNDIAEDSGGGIWIAGEKGVFRFFHGRVEQAAPGVAVSVIPISPDLVLAAVTPVNLQDTKLIRIRRGAGWTVEDVRDLHSPGPVTRDHSGMLLFPIAGKGYEELLVADVAAWRRGMPLDARFHAIPRFPSNGPLRVMRDRAGCLWIAATGGVNCDCGSGFADMPFQQADMGTWMHESDDGTMTLEGNNLLAVGRPGAFQMATRANGLPGLISALRARDGTIWLGSTTGLYRFASPFRIEYWTIREGLPDPPWALARLGQKVYAGMDRRIVVLGDDRSRWEQFATLPGPGSVTGMLGTRSGTLLATLVSGGAVELDARGRTVARTAPGHPPCCSMRVTEAEKGEYWISGSAVGRLTREGATLRYDEHVLQRQPSGNGLSVRYQPGTWKLWACYNGGLAVRDEQGVWKEITTRDGLAVNGCWSVVPLPNGDVWDAYYALRAFALLRFDSSGRLSVRQYGPDDGTEEPADDVFEVDAAGRLWRSGERGIYVASPAQAEAGQWLRLDHTDGFPANDMNSGSVFVDRDGSLWWGADNDLAHYRPAPDLAQRASAPAIFVSALSWDGAPRMASAVGGIPSGAQVTAHIGSLQFEQRNGMRLRYRVLPDRQAWRESAALDLPLGSLRPGARTIEVQARLVGGPWSPALDWRVTVLRPFWLTWPMMLGYAAFGTLLAAALWLRYRRQREAEALLLPDLAAWRMGALLPELHDLDGVLLDGRFRAGRLLARGGFAYVLEGRDAAHDAPCAIKVFRNEVKDQPWVRRRFRQEVAALERVRHPNVVTIYAHGETPAGAPYLVMEFIEGPSLREVLEAGALAAGRTARLLRQLGAALRAIHGNGICHRDVKPENIIVRQAGSPDEQAVLIDFSIAIVQDADETLHGLSRAAGTFDYMAPEQAVGYAQASSDIYSLAKIAIEMLTGKRLKDLLPDAALDLPDRARELLAGLPCGLSNETIARMAAALEFDPARRPAEAEAFAEAIARDLEGESGRR